MITFRPKARQDLTDIWNYTFDNWGEEQADRYVRGIHASFDHITPTPTLETPLWIADYNDLRPGYFGYKVSRHLIFYRFLPNGDIEVIRILHERMDIEDHLLDP